MKRTVAHEATEDDVRDVVARTCAEQGVPFTIDNPEALATIGAVVRRAAGRDRTNRRPIVERLPEAA